MAGTEQASIISAFAGGQSLGFFDTKSGGEATAEPTKRRSGGSFRYKQYGKLPEYADVVIGRVNENDRDTELLRWLRAVVGRVPGSVIDQPTDASGNPYGKPTTYTGMLAKIEDGATDVESANARMMTLTFQIARID